MVLKRVLQFIWTGIMIIRALTQLNLKALQSTETAIILMGKVKTGFLIYIKGFTEVSFR